MDEKEFKNVIALLQELKPNAGTEARIWLAKKALDSGDYEG